ncbi:hypothetical protein G9A89_007883 [Geosiphon pyriformis]|nr:hypothetical protein G9A89_007883 [Geosiphon pyriformis]
MSLHESQKILLFGPQHAYILNALNESARLASLAYCLTGLQDEIFPGILGRNILSVDAWRQKEFSLIKHNDYETVFVDAVVYRQFVSGEGKIIEKVNQVITIIKAKQQKIRTIRLIGHAWGGAYAVLTALKWFSQSVRVNIPVEVFTFGQPRMGELEFSKKINLLRGVKVYRVTHTDDFVPRLPNPIPRVPFVHHSPEIWIEIECDCENQTRVWFCSGRPINKAAGEILEHKRCNNQFDTFTSNSNNGPYFGHLMGVCPTQPNPPPKKPKKTKRPRQ